MKTNIKIKCVNDTTIELYNDKGYIGYIDTEYKQIVIHADNLQGIHSFNDFQLVLDGNQ